ISRDEDPAGLQPAGYSRLHAPRHDAFDFNGDVGRADYSVNDLAAAVGGVVCPILTFRVREVVCPALPPIQRDQDARRDGIVDPPQKVRAIFHVTPKIGVEIDANLLPHRSAGHLDARRVSREAAGSIRANQILRGGDAFRIALLPGDLDAIRVLRDCGDLGLKVELY